VLLLTTLTWPRRARRGIVHAPCSAEVFFFFISGENSRPRRAHGWARFLRRWRRAWSTWSERPAESVRTPPQISLGGTTQDSQLPVVRRNLRRGACGALIFPAPREAMLRARCRRSIPSAISTATSSSRRRCRDRAPLRAAGPRADRRGHAAAGPRPICRGRSSSARANRVWPFTTLRLRTAALAGTREPPGAGPRDSATTTRSASRSRSRARRSDDVPTRVREPQLLDGEQPTRATTAEIGNGCVIA